jgi:hypothetical protein
LGYTADGEDEFDAVVGLFSLLDVLLEKKPDGAPHDDIIWKIEGWICGLPLPPSEPCTSYRRKVNNGSWKMLWPSVSWKPPRES